MKKTTSKTLSKRLLQYGALSAAVLGVADVNGQIDYTDLDPDEVLNVGDIFIVDFTGSGNEFTVNNPDALAGGNAALIFPSSGGAFVGIGSGGFEYPALLANGDLIDGASGYTSTGIRGDLNYYGCAYSNSQWCDDVTDGYLGVSFMLSGSTHYGWIRLDTDVNGTNIITVKDFAYNETPDEAINAGQQTLSIENHEISSIKVVAFDKNINLSNLPETTNYRVLSITGKTILEGIITENNYVIEARGIATGIYIIELTDVNSSKVLKKKIVL